MESTALAHYGVKGMKWGVHKARQKSKELDNARSAYVRAKRGTSASEKEIHELKSKYKYAQKEYRANTTVGQKAERGAIKTAQALAKVGMLYATDQMFFKGVGTKVVQAAVISAVKATGSVTAAAVRMALQKGDIY